MAPVSALDVGQPTGIYEPRDSAQRVLYRIVRDHFERFRAQAASLRDGDACRGLWSRSFGFLSCGYLAAGFARFHCDGCGYNRLVPFSCKDAAFARVAWAGAWRNAGHTSSITCCRTCRCDSGCSVSPAGSGTCSRGITICVGRDSLQHQVRYKYDANGRLVRVIGHDGAIRRYTYTAHDQMATIDEPGTNIENVYGTDGRCIRQINRFPDAKPYVFNLRYHLKGGRVAQTRTTRSDGTWTNYTFENRYATVETWGTPVSNQPPSRTTAIQRRTPSSH